MTTSDPETAIGHLPGAKERLRSWWESADLGRPALDLVSPREPVGLEPMAAPPGWTSDLYGRDLDYRAWLGWRRLLASRPHAEAVVIQRPDLGPSSLAALLGSGVADTADTVWFGPCLTGEDLDPADIVLAADAPWWRFTLDLLERQRGAGPVGYPDLGENLDVLACLRGTERLLLDLFDRPDAVAACMERIDAIQAGIYDRLAPLLLDAEGGIHHWLWAPGRTGRFQCDTAAMLAPAQFERFVVPRLAALCRRHDRTVFHWDGVDALVHEAALLALPDLDVVQWVPGAGQPGVHDPYWWPLYRRILVAGKRVALVGYAGREVLGAMRAEFGADLDRFFLRLHVPDATAAAAVVETAAGG